MKPIYSGDLLDEAIEQAVEFNKKKCFLEELLLEIYVNSTTEDGRSKVIDPALMNAAREYLIENYKLGVCGEVLEDFSSVIL